MAAERGSAFLLKISDGAPMPVYNTVAGLRTTQMAINGEPVVITHKGSAFLRHARQILADVAAARTAFRDEAEQATGRLSLGGWSWSLSPDGPWQGTDSSGVPGGLGRAFAQ